MNCIGVHVCTCIYVYNATLVLQQKVLVVYRKPLADQDNPSHDHIEAEQKHIHSFINFASSFIWANLVSHAGK